MISRSSLLMELKLPSAVSVMARGLKASDSVRLCVDSLLAMETEDAEVFYDSSDVSPSVRPARLRKVLGIEESVISEPEFEYRDGKLTITGSADRLLCVPVSSLSVIKSLAQAKVLAVYLDDSSALAHSAFLVSATRALDDTGSSCEFALAAGGPWSAGLGPLSALDKFYIKFPADYSMRADEIIVVSYSEAL